jgi:hypothetical protein
MSDPVEDLDPVLPDYRGACLVNLVPALLEHPAAGEGWIPDAALASSGVVLLVLDGLGWHQLMRRSGLAPVMMSMDRSRLTTVAPSTTAAALTSITTGVPPGEHGVVGYRINVDGEVLNVLRWRTPAGDARETIPPRDIQVGSVFRERKPPVVNKAEFLGSGFTSAHLDPVRFVGYRTTATLVHEIHRLVAGGEEFVYAYYDGIDKVAHEYGFSDYYDAELMSVDTLVGWLLHRLPAGAALVITADHGLVHCDRELLQIHPDVEDLTAVHSGEARFRWLHARPGRSRALLEATVEHHGGEGWVWSRDEVIESGLLGPSVTPEAAHRLGDVALLARGTDAYADPAGSGSNLLIGRHGSLTREEMHVPLLVVTG